MTLSPLIESTPRPGPPGRPLRIACLAWGSLVWKRGPLALASDWSEGGPSLPIEFCRVGDGGELATTICAEAPRVPTRWALLVAPTLAVARDQLRRREAIDADHPHWIGDAPSGDAALPFSDEISDWAAAHGLDHVVWTALPPRYAGEEGRMPTVDEAVSHLQGLDDATRAHAEHYIRRVPADIRTPYRTAIEARLGWTPEPTS